jgi:hypothetical protein
MTKILQGLIKLYHVTISPLIGSRCRFVPTCSEYASQALEQYGVFKGGWLAVKRICRCHPWGGDGFDPVPDKNQERQKNTKVVKAKR